MRSGFASGFGAIGRQGRNRQGRKNGQHQGYWRPGASRRDSDFGREECCAALDDRSLLTDETLTLANVPRLRDVAQLTQILSNHGVDYSVNGKRIGQDELDGQTLHLTAREIVDTTAPYELVSKMRASFWVIGPLVARMHQARVSLPGGCAIGTRPVDFFIEGLNRSARTSKSKAAMWLSTRLAA